MPQHRGELTAKQVERISAAMQGLIDAQTERDQAIAAALKGGASVREVAAFTGLAPATVLRIGHKNGWPTEAQKRRQAEEKAERERWRQPLDDLLEERRRRGFY